MADIGLIGLAVMGENLALNIASKGFKIAVFNRTVAKVERFVEDRGKSENIIGTKSLKEFADSLKTPRVAILLVQAGKAVNSTIESLLEHFEKGDVIIDGGNSNYHDTDALYDQLTKKGILFVGAGVSGGEEGALKGPSIMPGGSAEAWPIIKPILQKISAQADGEPCCTWISHGGSGHFVKMVHNGIEYGDMQLIAEAYFLLKNLLGLTNEELHKVFAEWNQGPLDSYLIEITKDILVKEDEKPGTYVLDAIVDSAGQKGTGKWTASASLDYGMPLTLIGEAVFARFLSAQTEERERASHIISGPDSKPDLNRDQFIQDVHDALYASKIVSYSQGFVLLRAAEKEKEWNFDYGDIANMWRGGCIIRSKFLGNIRQAFLNKPELENLLLDSFFQKEIENAQAGWRRVVANAALSGIAVPAISSALAYFDGYRTAHGPANLIQAQRDYFGAHTFERLDSERGKYFHCNWTGHGGSTTSGSYVA